MGRQFQIVQLEPDIQDMWDFLRRHQLNIFKEGVVLNYIEELYKERLVAINETYIPGIGVQNPPVEYSVPYPIDTTHMLTARFYAYDSAMYEIKSTEGLQIIEEGRLYLSNEYYSNNAIVTIYNLIKKYIQKNYVYHKKLQVYFSKSFIEENKKGKVYYAQGTNIFPLFDAETQMEG